MPVYLLSLFNPGATMVDGMWNPSSGISYDFATVIYRWQLLGFNAIRLPFSFAGSGGLYNSASSPLNKLSTNCPLPSFVSNPPAVAPLYDL